MWSWESCATDVLFLDSFDATYLYDYSFILLYNLIFTSLPVIALGGKGIHCLACLVPTFNISSI